MKVVCISISNKNIFKSAITVGKTYGIIHNPSADLNYYEIKNDNDDIWLYPKSNFCTEREYRKLKLQQLSNATNNTVL